eukprot:s510_g8.t1
MVSSLANAVWERLQPKLVELQFMSEVQHSVPVAPDLAAWNTRHPEKSEPYKAEQEQIDQEAEEEEEEEYNEEDQFFHLAIEPDFPAQRQVKIMPLELFIDSARLHPF